MVLIKKQWKWLAVIIFIPVTVGLVLYLSCKVPGNNGSGPAFAAAGTIGAAYESRTGAAIPQSTGDTGVNSPTAAPADADTKAYDNNMLVERLDKASDETISYVYGHSPDNIKVDRIYGGDFTGAGKNELLVIFKLLDLPHAGGLDCSVAAVYDRETLGLIAQKTFPADECRFDVVRDNKGRGYLLYSGTTTYQGNSAHALQLFKPGKDWEQIPHSYGAYPNSGQFGYTLLSDDMVSVSRAIFKTDGSGEGPEWKREYLLRWDPETASLKNYIPDTYLDSDGKNYFDIFSVSPDGKYAVVPHEWGFDEEEYVLLYDIRENRLVKKYDAPAQYMGFTWSPDSKKVCISMLARIWTDISVLTIEEDKVTSLMNDIKVFERFRAQGVKLDYKLDDNRPDPAYDILEWSPDSKKLLVFYQCTDTKRNRQSGTFIYDIAKKSIYNIRQNDPASEGGNLSPEKPEGFRW